MPSIQGLAVKPAAYIVCQLEIDKQKKPVAASDFFINTTTFIELEFSPQMVDCCQDQNTGGMSLAPSRIPLEVAVKLTAREHNVLSMLLSGLSSKEIAAIL